MKTTMNGKRWIEMHGHGKVVPARIREHLCWDKVRGKGGEQRPVLRCTLSSAVRLAGAIKRL